VNCEVAETNDAPQLDMLYQYNDEFILKVTLYILLGICERPSVTRSVQGRFW
jgi:hypothetical protein